MESGAAQPPRSSAQLKARMDELRGMVDSGLLEAADIADEEQQLRAEARAWQLSTATVSVPLSNGWMRCQMAHGRCSPRACCRARRKQAQLRRCARP